MGDDPDTRNTYSDTDTDTDEPVHPKSGAEELRDATITDSRNNADGQSAGAQEPPD
jgi:hypothetical protein